MHSLVLSSENRQIEWWDILQLNLQIDTHTHTNSGRRITKILRALFLADEKEFFPPIDFKILSKFLWVYIGLKWKRTKWTFLKRKQNSYLDRRQLLNMSVSGVIFFRNVNFSANVMINDPFVYLNLPQDLWEVYLGVKIYPLNFLPVYLKFFIEVGLIYNVVLVSRV